MKNQSTWKTLFLFIILCLLTSYSDFRTTGPDKGSLCFDWIYPFPPAPYKSSIWHRIGTQQYYISNIVKSYLYIWTCYNCWDKECSGIRAFIKIPQYNSIDFFNHNLWGIRRDLFWIHCKGREGKNLQNSTPYHMLLTSRNISALWITL